MSLALLNDSGYGPQKNPYINRISWYPNSVMTNINSVWVKNTNPTQLHFIDSTGGDHQITPDNNILNQKGQLITYDGISQTTLSVGTNGQYLTANSSTATGLQWNNGARYIVLDGQEASINSPGFTPILRFIYPGSSQAGTIVDAFFIYRKAAGPVSYTVRLRDITNNQNIATVIGLTSASDTITNMGAITNVPVSQAILEFQGLRVGAAGALTFTGSYLLLSNV